MKKPLSDPFPWAEYLVRLGWVADTDMCWAQLMDRAQQRVALVVFRSEAFGEPEASADERDMITVIEERSDVWINVSNILDFFPMHDSTIKLMWSSERTGFRHIELVSFDLDDPAPAKRVPLTVGEWVVDNTNVTISYVADEVYFVGRKDTPTEAHLYRLPVRGLLAWIHGDPAGEMPKPGDPERVTQLGMFHDVRCDFFFSCLCRMPHS